VHGYWIDEGSKLLCIGLSLAKIAAPHPTLKHKHLYSPNLDSVKIETNPDPLAKTRAPPPPRLCVPGGSGARYCRIRSKDIGANPDSCSGKLAKHELIIKYQTAIGVHIIKR